MQLPLKYDITKAITFAQLSIVVNEQNLMIESLRTKARNLQKSTVNSTVIAGGLQNTSLSVPIFITLLKNIFPGNANK